MPPQITCASALPGKTGNTKIAFFTQMLCQCIARIQPVAPWFLQSFWLTTHTRAAVWLRRSCSQCVQLGAVGTMRCLPERKKMSSVMCLIASDICCDSKISH